MGLVHLKLSSFLQKLTAPLWLYLGIPASHLQMVKGFLRQSSLSSGKVHFPRTRNK